LDAKFYVIRLPQVRAGTAEGLQKARPPIVDARNESGVTESRLRRGTAD
jgi:hypothetical protein